MVNWALLANPFNWVVVFVIVVLGIAFTTFAHQLFNDEGNMT